jgi:hypothetical protein
MVVTAPLPCVVEMLAAPESVRTRTAIHEAGHVVVAKLLGARVESVTLHENGGGLARVWAAPRILLRSQFGGFLNERHFLEPRLWSAEGADPDIAEASRYATEIFADECAKRGATPTPDQLVKGAGLMLELDQELVNALLSANRCISRTIFTALVNFGALDEAQVNGLFEEGLRRQAADDRRMKAAGIEASGNPRIPQASPPNEESAPEARPGGKT